MTAFKNICPWLCLCLSVCIFICMYVTRMLYLTKIADNIAATSFHRKFNGCFLYKAQQFHHKRNCFSSIFKKVESIGFVKKIQFQFLINLCFLKYPEHNLFLESISPWICQCMYLYITQMLREEFLNNSLPKINLTSNCAKHWHKLVLITFLCTSPIMEWFYVSFFTISEIATFEILMHTF